MPSTFSKALEGHDLRVLLGDDSAASAEKQRAVLQVLRGRFLRVFKRFFEGFLVFLDVFRVF